MISTVGQHFSQESFVLKQPQVARRRFRLDMRKKFFTETVSRDWKRLSRAVEFPPLKVSKRYVDVELRDVV